MAQHGNRARAVAIALRRRREPDPAPWWLWALLALGLLLAGTVHAEVSPGKTADPAGGVLPPAAAAPAFPPGAGGSGTAPAPASRSAGMTARTGGARPTPDAGIVAPMPGTLPGTPNKDRATRPN